ncbi:MAG: cation diffusion facilitator family transporter [Candidatus Omnitrophota bacterium]
MQERFKSIRNILIGVLVFNWAVAAAKLLYGYISKCTAMSADGFHSFSDGASNIVGLIGIWVASQPVDKEHPYGHKKYETFSSIIISMLLFIISFSLLKDGIMRLFQTYPAPVVTKFSFVVMLCTIAVNTGVYIYERARSKALKSDILAADSQHTRCDILVSVSVVAALIAINAGFPLIDTAVSIAIALFIAYAAFNIMKDTSAVLCDSAVIVSDDIKNIVLDIDGVKGCHKIRTRGRQDDIHLDLHIQINRSMHVEGAHELTHKIQKAIKDNISGITDIAIHIEPYGKK